MLGQDEKEIPDEQKQGWSFNFQTRAFRQVLIVLKGDNPVGYINLDSDDDVVLWKDIYKGYFK